MKEIIAIGKKIKYQLLRMLVKQSEQSMMEDLLVLSVSMEFSFDFGKNITTGEGGAILSKNKIR